MRDQLDWAILDRYFSGECSPEETAAIERWVQGNPLRGQLLASARRVWDETGQVPERFDSEAGWQAFRQRRDAAGPPTTPVRPLHPRRAPAIVLPARRLGAGFAAAAAIVLAVGAALLWRTVGDSATPAAVETTPAVAMREYAAPRGGLAEFRLSDGTHVVLSPASTLRVPVTYAACTSGSEPCARDVYLDGEGYFEVTHDETRPFAVHAGDAVARDLGTAFTVRARAEERRVQVVVVEGEVELAPVAGGAEPALLTPGSLGRVEPSGALTVRRNVAVEPYVAWTEGRLVFKDTPLRDALPELSRWFDLDFRLADSALADRRLTATFRYQLDEDAVELLAVSLDLRHERRGRTVTFHSKQSKGR